MHTVSENFFLIHFILAVMSTLESVSLYTSIIHCIVIALSTAIKNISVHLYQEFEWTSVTYKELVFNWWNPQATLKHQNIEINTIFVKKFL